MMNLLRLDPGDARLTAEVARQPDPLVFATVSGAHLYGFPSPDSDVDLRGVHLLPAAAVVGLRPGEETRSSSAVRDGVEIDLVTHDLRKFIGLMLQRNGYVMEQLLSPLVVHTTAVHDELRALAPGCLTRRHAHHYLGFADTQRRLFERERRIKPLLYLYRVLLTGLHLLRTGEIEANLRHLNETARLPEIADLISRKTAGPERAVLTDADLSGHLRTVSRLTAELESARETGPLPDEPTAGPALDDLLVRVRLSGQLNQHADA